jgi:hypothetical protein
MIVLAFVQKIKRSRYENTGGWLSTSKPINGENKFAVGDRFTHSFCCSPACQLECPD